MFLLLLGTSSSVPHEQSEAVLMGAQIFQLCDEAQIIERWVRLGQGAVSLIMLSKFERWLLFPVFSP